MITILIGLGGLMIVIGAIIQMTVGQTSLTTQLIFSGVVVALLSLIVKALLL